MATPSPRTRRSLTGLAATCLVITLCVLDGAILPRVSAAVLDCDTSFKTGTRLAVPDNNECELNPGSYTYSTIEVSVCSDNIL